MAEIKNQFTSGKMNKDLDERIIPTGEYRDAMNIQVSTSEGSDVGTIQNILGNSIVPGQGFIPEGAYCVGSIADEKNDKLYYFITHNKDLITNGVFDNDASDWTLGTGWEYAGAGISGYIKGTDVTVNQKINQALPPDVFIEDSYYKIKFKVSGVPTGTTTTTSDGTINIELNNEDGKRFTISSYEMGAQIPPLTYNAIANGSYEFIKRVGSAASHTDTGFWSRFWIQAGANGFTGNIDDISIERFGGYIVEYDSKSNTVTPVIVDKTGFLQFSRDRLITGINIIDDMLFWTDNFSEPKKINIPRSIQGTDSSGLIHSNFINTKTSLEVPMKEEHVTVIKKQPTHAPKIKLISERESGIDSVSGLPWNYSGIMRITSPPIPITVGGQPNTQNTSSMWVSGSGANHYYDFSKLTVGSKFDTNIETDLNGDSGFFLKWSVGDILLFKEFGGNNFNDMPNVPLLEYSVRAKILDEWVTTNGQTDTVVNNISNGDFTIPNSNGTAPEGWTLAPQWTYLPQTNALKFDQADVSPADTGYNAISSPVADPVWEAGATYRVKFKISNYITGFLSINIVTPATSDFGTYTGTLPAVQTGRFPVGGLINANGEYSYDVTLSPFEGSIVAFGWPHAINRVYMFANNVNHTRLTLDYLTVEKLGQSNARVRCEVLEINNPPVVPSNLAEVRYVVDRLDKVEKLFEFSFPRIAYRYQYEDGEYSAISPFSQPVFLPGTFDYHPKDAYNRGMENRITSINISSFNHLIDGVTAIDIIYKDDASPNLYVIDTVKPNQAAIASISGSSSSNSWSSGQYIITNEQIGRAVESNQLLRPWDNVPKKALAQEISGNRVIYGNYTQGYDLKLTTGADYSPNFFIQPLSSLVVGAAKPSIKSLREYQVGAVFVDKYGRETPVISNKTGTRKLGKEFSDDQNKFKVEFNDDNSPIDLTHVKFFIKETADQYYNLAMDRFYDAEDGHVWLSFPSADRNKLSIDDFLILKKGAESDKSVTDNTKYKIIDIQNQAPEFITQRKLLSEKLRHQLAAGVAGTPVVDIFGSSMDDAPEEGVDTFSINYKPFSTGSASRMHEIVEDLYVEFADTSSGVVSKRYFVTALSTDFVPGITLMTALPKYVFRLEEELGDDVDFMSDGTRIKDGIEIRVYRYAPKETAQFDGRFFVKINKDESFSTNIISSISLQAAAAQEYRVINSQRICMTRSDHEDRHRHELTGLKMGCYRDRTYTTSNSTVADHLFNGNINSLPVTTDRYKGFGPWACFFRNYNARPDDYKAYIRGSSTVAATNVNYTTSGVTSIGQYKFSQEASASPPPSSTLTGSKEANWTRELGWITGGSYLARGAAYPTGLTGGSLGVFIPPAYMNGVTDAEAWGRTKDADSHHYTDTERAQNAVWYINGSYRQKYQPDSNLNPNLEWTKTTGSSGGPDGGIYQGSSAADWRLAIGGIYHQDVMTETDSTIEGFWGIGSASDDASTFNSNYQNSIIKDVVQQLRGGTKIRWKEDPAQTVYTIQTVQSEHGFINVARPSGSAADPANTTTYATSGSPDPATGVYGTGLSRTSKVANFDHVITQLSPNFSIRYHLQTKQTISGAGDVKWNPCTNASNSQALGGITNGITLSILSHTTSVAGTGGELKVFVSSLVANDINTGVSQTLKTGMILTKHGSTVYDGSTTTGPPPLYKGELLIYKITQEAGGHFALYLCGYREPITDVTSTTTGLTRHHFFDNPPVAGQAMIFKQPYMNGYSQFSCNRINAQNAMAMTNTGVYDEQSFPIAVRTTAGVPRIMPVMYTLEFVEEIDKEPGLPDNPAIWETEPDTIPKVDIYYEASGYNPLVLTEETKNIALPIGSEVSHAENSASVSVGTTIHTVGYDPVVTLAVGVTNVGGWYILTNVGTASLLAPLVGGSYITVGSNLNITKPDGSIISVKVTGHSNAASGYSYVDSGVVLRSRKIYISDNLYKDSTYTLNWHNCFAFGNGVESNRIRDSFNKVYITNGVKASTTLDKELREEHRKHGLIYSGIYNSNSGVNNLNQFIMAEKITKDLPPSYGSIQKLYSRNSDLVTFCEDRVIQIFADKDALYNADGDINLVSSNAVLGQAQPFSGEYGISTNPESFASEAYRAYFTDRVRGAVLRLSMDGLTAISDHGMKDWFRDNLSLGKTNLLGENCLDSQANWDIPAQTASYYGGNSKVVNGVAILGYYNSNPTTLAAYTSDAGNQPTDRRFGKAALLRMNNILEIGKTYRLQFDVIKHGGYTAGGTEASPFSGTPRYITINNTPSGLSWQGGGGNFGTVDGEHVDVTWVAARTTFELIQIQIQYNSTTIGTYAYDGMTTQDFVNSLVSNDSSSPVYDTVTSHFYGGTVSIKNLIVEEVKQPLKLIGSYDDRQSEYNITVDSVIPTTVSFKEDVTGWVSFKSFIPENGLSCANDYYTLKDGKLWQHHNPGVHRNTFYGQYTNSSFNAILNDDPSMIKSYHTLEYEGSKSRVEGIKTVTVTGIQHNNLNSWDTDSGVYFFFEEEEMDKLLGNSAWGGTTPTTGSVTLFNLHQYRNNIHIGSFILYLFDNTATDSNFPASPSGGPTKGFGRKNSGGTIHDWQVGDIITTQQLHMPGQTTISLQIVDPLNSTPQDGWFVSNIKTDKKQGSLLEFVEKEGKWFNYIKGVPTDYNSTDYFPDDFDFASFDVQGLGVVASSDTGTDTITITGGVNVSLQVGDCIYAKTTTNSVGFTQLSNNLTKLGIVTNILGNVITLDNLAVSVNNQYCVFIKDQIVNMSGLSGYYADAKFENNSKDKAELFVVSSEATESSK
jgi:hypothetical protein